LSPWTYYWLSVVVLAALLFLPVARLVWVLAVRRLERKLGRELSPAERDGQLNRARFIAALLCAIFSLLFNWQILAPGTPGGIQG
jgi:hypothetical protein